MSPEQKNTSQKESRISFDFTDRTKEIKLESKNANVFYGDHHVIKDVSLQIREKTVTAFIGPSGCGKSTFLRLFNRMNDYIGFPKTKSFSKIHF